MSFDSNKFLSEAPRKPGVYQMLDADNRVIYVGKAKNLKARLASYFRENVSPKTVLLRKHLVDIQLTVTNTEAEALLLENTLIKQHKPRYNVLLRDDKSYPYLYLSSNKNFPSLTSYRGVKRQNGQYFGPYVNTKAMREALHLIQKLFKLRSCSESFFKNRSRPCLQYQIKRCKAPCVGLVSAEEYQQDVEHTELFLQGKSQRIIKQLAKQMDHASQKLQYEEAGRYRDLIASLQQVQQRQYVVNKSGDVDIIALAMAPQKRACIAKLVVRDGQLLGNKWYFPKIQFDTSEDEILSAFLTQHYLENINLPKEIIIEKQLDNIDILCELLNNESVHKVKINASPRTDKRRWLTLAITNARQGLETSAAEQATVTQQFQQLQQLLNLDHEIERMECFDISHTQGQATIASCVVFDANGPNTSDYRRFNIKDITPGDDYAAMRQALTRRYSRLQQEAAALPDVLVIDGGKGQIKQAREVLQELQIDSITVLGIAKGVSRKANLETMILANDNQILNPDGFPAAQILLQHIRDEAHRFAITGHRAKRHKQSKASTLEQIEGVGPVKRRELLRHFGGLQQLKQAGVDDIHRVPGINKKLAERIHSALHGD